MGKIKENLQSSLLQEAFKFLNKNPIENIPKALSWAEKIPTLKHYQKGMKLFREQMQNPNSNWHIFTHKLLTEIHPNVRSVFIPNFFINATFLARPKALQNAEKYGCNIPWAILLDPTSACNLHCTGCWAGEYNQQDSLSYETIDSIIAQGKEIGIYMYLYSGGEPLVRKNDLLKLAQKHQDCAFIAFTNGTLIDQEFAEKTVEVGNLVFAISIEGLEQETDLRRGQGTYRKVIQAMDILKEAGAGFGYSCCYHSKNTPAIASDEFVDLMIEKGCRFAWYFTYIPIGKNSANDLIASPAQREYMYHRIKEIRNKKPLFAIDFWNDGEYVNGCIAGGRNYFHINAHGDVEPCAFIHYSNVNINESTLLEALKSPLFAQYKENQPFNQNHLRPCPLMDNPDLLKTMVHKAKAQSTQPQDRESVDDLTDKLQDVAKAWAEKADVLWAERTKK